jgi:hypothetical protein
MLVTKDNTICLPKKAFLIPAFVFIATSLRRNHFIGKPVSSSSGNNKSAFSTCAFKQ